MSDLYECVDCTVRYRGFSVDGCCPSCIAARDLAASLGSLHTTATGTEEQVCKDIAERQQRGIAKYNTTVRDNPLSLRQWIQHAYEECLDQAVYLKRAMEEMDR